MIASPLDELMASVASTIDGGPDCWAPAIIDRHEAFIRRCMA